MIKKRTCIAGVPNIIATTEGKGSEKTKFDSTCAESEIVVMTDENSDEVGTSFTYSLGEGCDLHNQE